MNRCLAEYEPSYLCVVLPVSSCSASSRPFFMLLVGLGCSSGEESHSVKWKILAGPRAARNLSTTCTYMFLSSQAHYQLSISTDRGSDRVQSEALHCLSLLSEKSVWVQSLGSGLNKNPLFRLCHESISFASQHAGCLRSCEAMAIHIFAVSQRLHRVFWPVPCFKLTCPGVIEKLHWNPLVFDDKAHGASCCYGYRD